MKNSFVMPNFISKKAQFYIYILVIYDITKFSALDGLCRNQHKESTSIIPTFTAPPPHIIMLDCFSLSHKEKTYLLTSANIPFQNQKHPNILNFYVPV